MQRNVVNHFINIAERKKQNVNSERGSEAHVCNSALSPDGAFVYCIISIGARSGSTRTITERSRNFFCMCVCKCFDLNGGKIEKKKKKRLIVDCLKILRQELRILRSTRLIS